MSESAKARAKAFIKKYDFYKPSLNELKKIIESQGYVLVEYNGVCDDDNVKNVICSLKLDEYVKYTKAFTYVSDSLRLIFVHEDLSEEEKLLVLLHEEGHIFCRHFSESTVLGSDVWQEKEANDFAHYIQNQPLSIKLSDYKKTVTAAACVGVVTIAATGFMLAGNGNVGNETEKETVIIYEKINDEALENEEEYYGEYYFSSGGYKYHREDCRYVQNKTNIARLTVKDYESGDYEPCKVCIEE